MNTYTIVIYRPSVCHIVLIWYLVVLKCSNNKEKQKDNFRLLNTLPKFHQQLCRHYQPTIQQSLSVGSSLNLLICWPTPDIWNKQHILVKLPRLRFPVRKKGSCIELSWAMTVQTLVVEFIQVVKLPCYQKELCNYEISIHSTNKPLLRFVSCHEPQWNP